MLRREADKYFSRYVRLRDSEVIEEQFWGKCITCEKRFLIAFRDPVTGKLRFTNLVDNGHFVSRGYMATRYEEENCNLQCKRCNKWLNGNLTKYRVALDEKYGDGTAEKLEHMALENKGLTKLYLEEVIHDSKEQIKFYEAAL